MILVNSPQNPTGKVFSQEELSWIGELCVRYHTIALCDEVYEHILFDGSLHLRLATFPGMWEQTLTLSSLGKTFSVTGWKIGWAIGSAPLVKAVQKARQWMSFSVATPFQEAAAVALEMAQEQGYFQELARFYQKKRDYLVQALEEVGLKPFVPQGTYFVMADIQAFGFPQDLAFCRYLVQEVGVAAIPPSFFYSSAHQALGHSLARFTFCKTEETLEQALHALKKNLRPPVICQNLLQE
jgi:N-succinyldiaminopimelate aminotransferase